jgi:ubiquinone/menaquinone biosynthesis C-methylase UbiE
MFGSELSSNLGQMSRIDALLVVLPSLKDAYIIDLGCGEGEVARALAAGGARVSGYDPFVGEPISWTQEREGEYRLGRARANAVPEADGCADAVLFVYSLHHVPQAALGGALAEAHRLLKPTGRLCVVEPVAEGPAQYVMELYHDETTVRGDALAALETYAAPRFGDEEISTFVESTTFPDFDAYAARAKLGARFNSYTVDQVTSPEVRERFSSMSALNRGAFDQPVRINVFSRPHGARSVGASGEKAEA